ncbi:hypothetical protein JTB14_034554 [Gonioctena quinquepunctata]|nr:hypothetical protein JTB14_034554 [Gonioctena quinquepunctata]
MPLEHSERNMFSEQKYSTIKTITNNGQEINETKHIANRFNEHFISVGKNLANQIVTNPQCNNPKRIAIANSMFIKPTDTIQIIRVITSLKNNKTPGVDAIKSETLKQITESISDHSSYNE